uniref:Uncharacterized protein n=1 Tax=Pinguiococcus pyrenoidosus TaxID=172671 RepID=A0A7R9U8G9_9STRA
MPVGGALKLKGGASLKSRKKSKKEKKEKREKKRRRAERDAENEPAAQRVRRGAPIVKPEDEDDDEEVLLPIMGRGHLTSSGTVISGHGTQFSSELEVGDNILIRHPTTLMEESRQVRMLLSDISLSVDAPFSSDLVSTTSFRYLKLPKDDAERKEEEEDAAARRRKNRDQEESSAVGTYSSDMGTRVTMRVKKAGAYGGYQIIHQQADTELTRSELLELRSKHKADRHCM